MLTRNVAFLVLGLVGLAHADRWKTPASSAKVKEAQALLAKKPPDTAGAKKILEDACKAKDGLACALAGDAAIEANDAKRGLAFYEQACTAKWPWACFALADILEYGKHEQKKDPKRQVAFLEKGCAIGLDEACEQHGLVYLNGNGPKSDEKKALQIWEAACKAGSGRSCFQAGGMYREGRDKIPKTAAKAGPLFVTGCTAGDIRACLNGGIMYDTGEGVGADHAKAAQLFKTGCAATDVEDLLVAVHKDLCERSAKAK